MIKHKKHSHYLDARHALLIAGLASEILESMRDLATKRPEGPSQALQVLS